MGIGGGPVPPSHRKGPGHHPEDHALGSRRQGGSPGEAWQSESLFRQRLSDGVPSDSRGEPFHAALEYLQAADQVGPASDPVYRTLSVQSPFFTRYEARQAILELGARPDSLRAATVDQRAWKGYQAYLSRIRPVDRADFYERLKEREGCKSLRALARITGEDWSRVARALKVLELPSPVLDYLRTHDSQQLSGYFSERRLRQLLALKDPKKIWTRFQGMLKQLSPETATA